MGALRRHACEGQRGYQESSSQSRRQPDRRSGEVHDRRAAKAKLREARSAINDRNFEQAEAIALEVKGWGLSYGLFEDNPDKVASAARALRRRDKIRNTPARDQSSLAVYDVMVQESRRARAGRQA